MKASMVSHNFAVKDSCISGCVYRMRTCVLRPSKFATRLYKGEEIDLQHLRIFCLSVFPEGCNEPWTVKVDVWPL